MLNVFLKRVTSSIIKKQMVGVTGLLLCGFLLGHLAGNFLIFVGPEAFNKYAHTLTSNPLIYVAEAGLATLFLIHLGMAIKLTIENKAARPQSYYLKTATGRGSTIASSTMPITGLVILVFLIFHILHLKFGPVYETNYQGVEMRDLYKLLIEYFSNPLAVIWYIIAMICVGIHTSHGFWSAFQTIGFNHPKYTPMFQIIAKLFAFGVSIGFGVLPIYCYLQGAQ